jgi:DNA repair exonuclease SbcCD ATPase subunit
MEDELTVPVSGRIDKVFLIGDVHIRSGTRDESRYDEYAAVFDRLILRIATHPSVASAVTVISGDIFHNKGVVGPCGLKLFGTLVQGIAEHTPVYMILGNHDVSHVHFGAALDMLDGCVALLSQLKNVHYLKSTGIYMAGDVGFSVVSVKDTIRSGATCGLVDELPPFPKDFPEGTRMRIAVFHGTVVSAKLQNFTPALDGVPLEWIDGFDCALLGDIHLPQSWDGIFTPTRMTAPFREDGRVTWAYPGSTVQQSFGESPVLHGMQVWDLEARTISMVPIPSPVMYLKARVDASGDWVVDNRHHGFRLADIAGVVESVPDVVHVRVVGREVGGCAPAIMDVLKNQGVGAVFVSEFSAPRSEQEVIVGGSPKDTVEHLNSPNTWIDYIKDCTAGAYKPSWESWINSPHTMAIDIPEGARFASPAIADKALEKNTDIVKAASAFQSMQDRVHSRAPFKLVGVSARWILCYETVRFGFGSIDGSVALLHARNGHGKSSFFEIILIGLFGQSMGSRLPPSRERSGGGSKSSTRSYSGIVYNGYADIPRGAKNGKPSVEVSFVVNGVDWTISRRFKLQSVDDDACRSDECSLVCTSHPQAMYPSLSNKSAVDEWVRANLGDCDAFVMSCMMTQGQDANFLEMPPDKQMDHLQKALNFESLNSLRAVIDTRTKALESIDRDLGKATGTLLGTHTVYDGSAHAEFLEQKSALEAELCDKEADLVNMSRIVTSSGATKEDLDGTTQCDAALRSAKNTLDVLRTTAPLECAEELASLKYRLANAKPVAPMYQGAESGIDAALLSATKAKDELCDILTEADTAVTIANARFSTATNAAIYSPALWEGIPEEDLRLASAAEEALNAAEALAALPLQLLAEDRDAWLVRAASLRDQVDVAGGAERVRASLRSEVRSALRSAPTIDAPAVKPTTSRASLEAVAATYRGDIPCYVGNILDALNIASEANTAAVKKVAVAEMTEKAAYELVRSVVVPDAPYIPIAKVSTLLSEWKASIAALPKSAAKLTSLSDFFDKLHDADDAIADITATKEKYVAEADEIEASIACSPFNPECDACRSQPARAQLAKLRERIHKANTDLSDAVKSRSAVVGRKKPISLMAELDRLLLWDARHETLRDEVPELVKAKASWDARAVAESHRMIADTSHSEARVALDTAKAMARAIETDTRRTETEATAARAKMDLVALDAWEEWDTATKTYRALEAIDDLMAAESILKNIGIATALVDKAAYWQRVVSIQGVWEKACTANDEFTAASKAAIDARKAALSAKKAYDAAVSTETAVSIARVNRDLLLWTTLELTEKEVDRWMAVETAAPHYAMAKELEAKIVGLRAAIQTAAMGLGGLNSDQKRHEKERDTLASLAEWQASVRSAITDTRALQEAFNGYQTWVFKERIVPDMCASANEIVSRIATGCSLRLKGDVLDGVKLSWAIVSDGLPVRIHKASGFQKFIFGVAIRVAMAKMGGRSSSCRQFFVDEGFTSLDSVHLDKVPGFLHGLIGDFDSVLVVTHMGKIRDNADVTIEIRRTGNRSILEYGADEEGVGTALCNTPRQTPAKNSHAGRLQKYEM